MLAPEARARLEARAAAEERATSSQVVVAIFPSLEGESLEDVSIRLAERWKIGQRERNNGVLLLVFLKEHKLRIEVGYGFEGRLTDAVAASIIRNQIAPRFRQDRYAEGLDAGLTAIFQAVAGEYRAAPPPRRGNQDPLFLLPLLFPVVVFLIMAWAMAGARRQAGLSGRRGYTLGPGGWYIGSGGFGGGGFGGGGFSGGGGSFGGGGSSGSW